MIRVDVDIEGLTYTAKMTGHAYFAEPGQDIVCAAASMLYTALCQEMIFISEDGGGELHKSLENGDYWLVFEGKTWSRDRADNVVHMFQTGITLLQSRYPDYVQYCFHHVMS